MCGVDMDLQEDANLKFAIYNMVMSRTQEFSVQDLVNEVRSYQDIEEGYLIDQLEMLLDAWVNSGVLKEYIDTYAVEV